ncbi:DUF4476 domain-containing protein [uncultured Flavobacterium sp.]|uniref:DUF4476 domain-containing protein n=1 Tax=uncultured Flavobacterium sp. TaxID=165435 RepID=UPI0027E0EBC2|nr:DUF4476 domain-containing protein [uncultured Flavobacterium sp.]
MRKLYFAIAATLTTAFAFAQAPTGNLTIFSEDGDRFFLVLNGELQNDIPQTNIRVEELNQPYYNAKILFEDKSLVEITKKNLAIADIDGEYMDVTYKIKRDKNNKNKLKLNFFSEIPVDRQYRAPQNVHVVHYGAPQPVSTVSHTTTTTTVGNTGMGVGVNVGGVGVNINIKEPNGIYTETTTTTVTHGQPQVNYAPPLKGCNNKYPMGSTDFNSALTSVKKQGFDETKLKVAKQIVSANCLDVNQIKQIANTISFEENKLDFVKFAYDYCTEKKNYFRLNDIFSFSTNVDDLTEYIRNK